jgi:thiol:disulfide interchange protein DsbA
MRLFRHILAAISLGLLVVSAGASPANPQNGTDYRTLEQIQPAESGDKIEVIEFFWYNCSHCAVLEPVLSAWVKKQGDRIVFRQVPIAFRDSLIPQQKLYYALEAMGKTAEMNPKVFQAIHVENQRIDTDKTILAFIEKQGIDKQKFLDMYNSFGVQAKVRRAAQLQEAYKIDGVPVLAIGGRFLTSPAMLGASMVNQPESALNVASLQVIDHLIARLEAEKGSTGAGRKR